MASLIDRATFDELRSISGEDFIRELMDTFMADGPSLLEQMKTSLAAADVDSFRRAAHSLKSNAATFGALELSVLAKELEYMARDNNLNVGNKLEVLEQAYHQAASELESLL